MTLTWTRTCEWDSEDWREHALCRDTDPNLFFPVGSTGPAVEQIRAAKVVCGMCPSRQACFDFAIETNQESGIWGGTTEDERRIMRKAFLAERHRPAFAS